ncbi:MAG: ferrochelatase [Candidatus Tokpelaia sp. JSC161]|jgi:ferrochelatase|nr:MAG: ferrochelatase [Candidatus Tokpelaia sp. JSC161]
MEQSLREDKIGVLLINVGTPEGLGYFKLCQYLAEFLSDKRIIELWSLLWYPILYVFVLNVHYKKSKLAYLRVWDNERKVFPLRFYTSAQAQKLRASFSKLGVDVDWAMRYGNPSIKSVTNSMIVRGCTRILMFPLYPQYSAVTTATVNDVFFSILKKRRFIPAIRTISSYAANSVYIDALASSVLKHFSTIDFIPDVILVSYHGIPKNYVERGDPYLTECKKTTTALRRRLNMDEKSLIMTFQSRFGLGKWLKPYTERTVKELAHKGIQSLAVLTPGFVSDCLETLDEVCHKTADLFYKNGGKNFTHIPCLNDSEEGMSVIEHLVRMELLGWL